MKTHSMYLVLLLILCCPNALLGQDGVVHERSFIHDDSLRTYLMYVPAAYDGTEDWPLVINYHGFRSNATFQMNYTQMNAVADTAHFLIAYPQGLTVANQTGPGLGWAIPNVASENDDISFTSNLINHIDTEFSIDMARIHAAGWSQGSVMAYYLACSLPESIASVAGVAGNMPFLVIDNCETNRSISALHIHGTLDPLVPFEGRPGVFPAVPTTPSFWASRNNCAQDSVVTELEDVTDADSSTVTRIEYFNCDDETEVLFYRINDGGHPWPGSTPIPGLEFLGHTNQDINASAEMLEFFVRNPRPTVGTSIEEEKPKLVKTDLHINVYPNPFTEQFTLAFDLPQTSPVKLTLFNVLGQRIVTIIEQTLPAGDQSIDWKATPRGLPSGLYFLRLQIEDEHVTKPVLYSAK